MCFKKKKKSTEQVFISGTHQILFLKHEIDVIFIHIILKSSLALEYNPFNSNSQLFYLLVYIYGTTSLDMIQS